MSSNVDVARIETAFAQQYDLDLPGLHKDIANLRTAVAAPLTEIEAAASYTYNGSLSFVPDLETIDPSQVVPDQRLSIRQIEANLDEASKYSQACLQIRTQYGDTARHRNDTRFKGEEFIRLDGVHLQEIEAGIYKLPWQEAADEVAGLELAIAQANVQRSIPEEMTSTTESAHKYASILSDQGMSEQVDSNAFIARNVANQHQDEVYLKARSTAGYRTHMELATWLETLAGANSALAQMNSKLAISKRKEEYLRKDEGFKLERWWISRQLAWLQIAEHCRDGSELNYDQRLGGTKSLFDANLRPLIERAMVLDQGLKKIYGIDLPLGTLSTRGILDQIAGWLVEASDALSKWKRTQRLTITQIVNNVTVSNDRKTFETAFSVDDSSLPRSNALLRGINFEFVGDSRVPISASVAPPADVVLGGNSDPLRFGRVGLVAPNLELRPQHSDLLWNGSPKGVWSVTGSLPSNAGSIEQIVMYLWIVST